MLRALLLLVVVSSCAPAPTTFLLHVTHIGTGPVTGASGSYEPLFSSGWARTDAAEPLFTPGAFADDRLKGLATAGDALTYIGTEGASFPEDLAATYSDAQLHPGERYTARFEATPGAELSFGCMFGPSNDTIAGAPAFALFDGEQPLGGDITSRVAFYDVGVEVNEEPGFGAHQPAHGTGGTAEHRSLALIDGTDTSGHSYPDLSTLLRVELEVAKKR